VLTSFALFVVLLSYPITRSVSEAYFIQQFGAQKSPLVWLYSVALLSLAVIIYNHYQSRFQAQKLFLFTALFTFAFFLLCSGGILFGQKLWGYPLFIWKEVYVILLLHMAFGYLNTMIDVKVAKILYGPIGALMASAGIVGGALTSWLTSFCSIHHILLVGNLIVLSSAALFYRTTPIYFEKKKAESNESKPDTPLRAIGDAKKYVYYITLIIAISQFVINLAQFKFNVLFAQILPDVNLKTAYLGKIYFYMNSMGLLTQLILTPVLLKCVSNRNIHYVIPFLYLGISIFGFGIGGNLLVPVATAFIVIKGVDYSLFSTVKEILYFILDNRQKYGAKYLVDMVSYRAAKGVISVILLFKVCQSPWVVNFMLFAFLGLWPVALFLLFREEQKIIERKKR